METITARAYLDQTIELNILFIHGYLVTYHDDDQIEVRKSSPQGFNPDILLLKIVVKEGNSPMKGTPKLFSYICDDSVGETYKQVSLIFSDNGMHTVDVIPIKG